MYKPKSLLTVITILLMLVGCQAQQGDNQDEVQEYNPYVEAFTSGKISRTDPIYLIFNQDIPESKQDVSNLKKRIKIKPQVDGDFTFEDNRTIRFNPAKEMKRNTSYEVIADLSDWFDVDKNNKKFTCRFSTLPFTISSSQGTLKINPEDVSAYDIEVHFYTVDKESEEFIQSIIGISPKIPGIEWEHIPNGKRHTMTLKKVSSDIGTITVGVVKNKYNIPEEELQVIDVPSANELSVYAVQLNNDDERYIEVTFNQPLDANQDFRGLVQLNGGAGKITDDEPITINGNTIRIYPSSARKGSIEVTLNQEIKAKSGIKLNTTVIRSIQISEDLPGIEFIGKGVIVPPSSDLNIPFRSVYLKGVIVRVIRIKEHNIGQFLQINRLEDNYQMKRVGRLVARKTIFFDERAENLYDWNTFAINLKDIMEPEPGALYRIELSMNRDLSVYPCEEIPQRSKEEILAEDAELEKREMSGYDRSGSYYYYDYDDYEYYYDDYSEYDYRQRENPCSKSYYVRKTVARNVLATNLAIIAKRGELNEMTVLVNNIRTAYPERGVKVTLHNYQHDAIGSGFTAENGIVNIPFTGARPFYIIADDGTQKSYLRVDDGSSLSISNFDVSGEVVQKGIKGFIYGDRGVWRPGDTLYLSFMLNDRDHTLPDNHPVIMELYDPNGQLYLKKTKSDNELGIYAFDMPTSTDAPTGAWNVQVKVGGVTFYKRVRIETIKPNRLKIEMKHVNDVIVKGDEFTSNMHVEWMQGATARSLKYEIEGTFTSVKTQFPKFKDYTFDFPTRTFDTEEIEIASGTTDENGDATITFKANLGSRAPGMLQASLFTRVYEESGDFSIDGERILYSPYRYYVGIKSPQTGLSQLDTDKEYTYGIATVDYNGNPASGRNVEVSVYRVERYWWWSSNYKSLANYINDSHNKPIETKTIKTNAAGEANYNFKAAYNDWGTYYITVKDEDSRHIAGISNYYDWPGWAYRRDRSEGSNAANMLVFHTDKDSYEPGELITLTIPSTQGSRAYISIENGNKVISISEQDCAAGETVIRIEATEEMMPNAYANVTLVQPHAQTTNDLPVRMYGVVPFRVNSSLSRLNPLITMPDEIKPEKEYELTISETNGREMAYTLAIVDEGLLDLTRFRTPEPWNVFNAREALGVTTWDLYNSIVGAYGGRIEQIFSIGGDDDLNAGPKATANRFKPVVQFDGPFLLKKGEKRKHTYLIPNYNGRVRVMVVAGDGKAYGNIDKSVFVRKPVMLLGTLPRVIGINEEMDVPATVFATENKVGTVKVSIECSDNMEIIGKKTQELQFDKITDKQANFRIKVKNKEGIGKVKLIATGKGETTTYETEIGIRSVRRPVAKVEHHIIEPGKSWKGSITMPGADGTNNLCLEASDIMPVNLSYRLSYLIGYPHGCVEQITSKAFPQLYVGELTNLSAKDKQTTEMAVKETIKKLRSYLTPGGFAYWPGTNNANSWGTIYATHFLIEAEMKGYVVPDHLKRSVLSDIKKAARDWKAVDNNYARSEEITQAYRLYVLALAKQSEIGAMNRLKEKNRHYDISRWLLSAAYALIGRQEVANELINKTEILSDANTNMIDYTYGSTLRDQAIRLQTLVLLKKNTEAVRLAKAISEELSTDRWLSTQETAFSLMAFAGYVRQFNVADQMKFSYQVGNTKDKIDTNKHVWSETLLTNGNAKQSVEIENTGKSTLFVQVITEGTPEQGEEKAHENDVSIEVSYADAKGKVVQVDELQQGTNFTAKVTVKNKTSKALQNLVVSQIFPAGWEILNTRFLEGDSSKDPYGVSYQDIRDDRVYSYIDYLPNNRHVTLTINLCAIYPGNFYLPPVYCEAMYNNLTRANTEGKQVKVK